MSSETQRDLVGRLAEDYERKRQIVHNISIANTSGLTAEERVAQTREYHQAIYDLNAVTRELEAAIRSR